MRSRATSVLVSISFLAIVACGGGGDGGGGDGGGGMTDPNTSPSASIDGPEDEANVDEGVEITFQGSASDPEDGDLTGGSLVWESDRDGEIGTGATVGTSDLSQGHHTVTLTATDSEGASATQQVGVLVRPAGESINVDVPIGDNFFEDLQGRRNEEAFVRIRLGDDVTWTNNGGNIHTVTSGEGTGGDDGDGVPDGAAGSMNSGNMQNGGTYTFQPDAVGTWTYYCEIHPGVMIEATIEVEQG